MLRVVIFATLLAGCGDPGQLGRSTVSPSDVVTRVALEDVPVLGAEVKIVRRDDSKVSGELLEAEGDHVTLLHESALVRIGTNDIRQVVVTRYENKPIITIFAVWSAVGAAVLPTHGKFAFATEPIWGGMSAGVMLPVAADEGRFAYAEKQSDFVFLREYARFPQGIPPRFAAR